MAWLYKAAEQGHASGFFGLGYMHMTGGWLAGCGWLDGLCCGWMCARLVVPLHPAPPNPPPFLVATSLPAPPAPCLFLPLPAAGQGAEQDHGKALRYFTDASQAASITAWAGGGDVYFYLGALSTAS